MSVLKHLYQVVLDSPPTQLAAAGLARLLPPPYLTLTLYDVTVPGLPAQLHGLRVLHVTDLHLRLDSRLASELPELVAGVPHDLALYTGDFVDDADGLPLLADTLRRLPRPEAAFAVLGNHDYGRHGRQHCGAQGRDVSAVLAEAGIQVLSNSAHSALGAGLFIAGVDDPSRHRDDLDHAMASVPEGACCLLLAHSPDIVLRLGQHRPGLILAGHTHGGQIRLPLAGPLITMSRLPRRQVMGLHEYQGVPTFVSRGIGYSGVNLRLWCPPEVALLTLRSPLAAERAA